MCGRLNAGSASTRREGAIAVSIDEKTSIQAKEPMREEIPMAPGKPARREFKYKRDGTIALLATLLVHTVEIKGEERNSRVEFLDFLELLEAEIPEGKEVHAILDNLPVHKTAEVVEWLEAHPRRHFHLTPNHVSWLNQTELSGSRSSRVACSQLGIRHHPHRAGAPAGRSTPVAYGALRGPAGSTRHRLQPHDSNMTATPISPPGSAI